MKKATLCLLLAPLLFSCASSSNHFEPDPHAPDTGRSVSPKILEAGPDAGQTSDIDDSIEAGSDDIDGSINLVLDAGKVLDSGTSAEQEASTEPSFAPIDAGIDGSDHSLEVDADSPDTGVACAISLGSCNPVDQCGCAENESCVYVPAEGDAGAATHVCEPPGTIEAFSACEAPGDCQAGLVCHERLCKPTCRFDEDCPSVRDSCHVIRENDGESVSGIRVCDRSCDTAVDLDTCGEGARCGRSGLDILCGALTSLRVASEPDDVVVLEPTLLRASVNETCFRDLDCDVSLVCAPQGRCRPTCNNNNDCSFDGTSCDYYSAFRTGVCGANCSFDETPGSSCGTYPFNCGCPSGESCKVTEGQASVCVQDGPQTTFEWCTRDEHCGVDLSCQGGLCRPICDPDDTSSDAFTCGGRFGTCMTSLISNVAETTVCSGYCDPVEPLNVDPLRRPCGEGGYCYPGIGDIKHAFCVQEDISHSPRTNGEACDDEYDCRSGLGCSNGTCQAYCHSEAPCSGNRTCNILSPKRYGKDQTELLGLCQ